ncbi:hypothetical protein ACHAXT_009301 [Thalassiosira profunda]
MSDMASLAPPRPSMDGAASSSHVEASAAAAPPAIQLGEAAASPAETPGGSSVEMGPADLVLSLRDDRYRTFMWAQFNRLGKAKDYDRDERLGRELFDQFKAEGVQNWYKLPKLGRQRTRVDEGEALEIITTHLKRRTESAHRWMKKARAVAKAASAPPERETVDAPATAAEASSSTEGGPAASQLQSDAKPAAAMSPAGEAVPMSREPPPVVHRPLSTGAPAEVESLDPPVSKQPGAQQAAPLEMSAIAAAEPAPVATAGESTQDPTADSGNPQDDMANLPQDDMSSLPQEATVSVPGGDEPTSKAPAAPAVQSSGKDFNRLLQTEEKKQEEQDVAPTSAAASSIDSGPSSIVTHDGHEAGPAAESKDPNGPEGAPGSTKEVTPPTGDVILSLNEEYYREVMWSHYRTLGKARDSERETEFADTIFELLKNRLGKEGKFYKSEGHAALLNYVEVDDEMAYNKIIADIRRRMKNYRTWSTSPEKQPASRTRTRRPSLTSPRRRERPQSKVAAAAAAKPPAPKGAKRRSPRKPASASKVLATKKMDPPAEGDVTLSMDDDLYRDVMWTQYNLLGRKGAGDNSREVAVGKQLLALFKGCLGKGSKFMKRDKRGGVPSRVDDQGALLKITRDLKRRNETMQKWHGYKSKYHMTIPANEGILEEDSSEDESMEEQEEDLDDDLLHDDPLNFLEPSLTEDYAWRDQLAPSPIEALDETLPTAALPHVAQQSSKRKPKISVVELLSASHLGQRMPPLKTIPFVKSVHTANQLVYALQHATLKLNELNFGNGPRSKHAKLLRLYNLPELNEEYTGGAPKAPILNQLADSMETTPKSMRKWFAMYLNAVERGFDFERDGKEKIKDHHGIFFGERYQFTFGGDRALEEYFLEAGNRIVGDAENSPSSMPDYNIFAGPPGVGFDQWSGLDFESLDTDAVVNPAVELQPPPPTRGAMKSAEDVTLAELLSEEEPNLDKNPFLRYYRRNEARLVEVQYRLSSGIEVEDALVDMKLNPVAKRVNRGTKHRVLCMVEGCEKHSQTKCDGCCQRCFRVLNTIPIKQTQEGHVWTPPGTLGKRKAREEAKAQPVIPKASISLDQLQAGARIYIEWEADHGLYKATVKKIWAEKGKAMVKLHYDGKKKHIFDSVPFDRVHSFIPGENDAKMKAEEDCQEVAAINQAHLAAQASEAYDLGRNRRTFASLCSESKRSSSRQGGSTSAEARAFVTISPVTIGQFGAASSLSPPRAQSSMKVPGVGPVSVGESSAFASPSRPARPTLHHQLYHSPGQQFPGMKRPAGTSRVQRKRTVSERGGARGDVHGGKRPKRQHKPAARFEVEHSSPSRPASDGPTKSILCHCPVCPKRDMSVQGIYAHFGRAHSAKVDWPTVTFSCPFCTGRAAGRVFKSIRDVEMHAIAAHPGCIVQGPHTPKTSGQSKRAKVTSGISPKSNRALRERKSFPPILEEDEYEEESEEEEEGPPRWDQLDYGRLLPDGRKDYPSELFRVVDMIDDQCQRQEKEVEGAREQRAKLFTKEAEMEARALDEERLAYQRGIRERTSLADQERLEKLKYAERADEMTMRYEHEVGDSKRRQQEEAEMYKLCSRPIQFQSDAGKHHARQTKPCPDDQCQFCTKDKGSVHHLLLDSEMRDFDVDAPTTKSPLFQRDTKVLNPAFSLVGDEHFVEADEADSNEDAAKEASGGSKRVGGRREATTAKRLKTEEERLWVLQNTKRSLEFIKRYNEGLLTNAWGGGMKDSRGRRVY